MGVLWACPDNDMECSQILFKDQFMSSLALISFESLTFCDITIVMITPPFALAYV